MGRLSKKLVSIVATVVVASTVMAQTPLNAIAADNGKNNNLEVQEDSKVEESSATIDDYSKYDGVMLHAWNWSFNNIKENMKEIAEAGYTAVQTSPAQECRLGNDWENAVKEQSSSSNDKTTWYYVYQPTKLKLGNAYLGTKEDFNAMCEEAHKYGIKVVVDVVANHLADVGNDTAHQALLDQTLWGDARKCSSASDPNRIQPGEWNIRDRVTQGCVIGMPDINTASETSQGLVSDYLDELLDNGADAFRFDAAKSIELPDGYESGSIKSDFWPNVLSKAKEKKSDLFVYGEVLVGMDSDGANGDGYAKFMRITGSDFSQMVRYSVGYDVWNQEVDTKDYILGVGYYWDDKAGEFKGEKKPSTEHSVAQILNDVPAMDWGKKYPADKTVGYFETHDTYGNSGATRAMTKEQREVCWAEIASRKGVLPLWFNRPVDSDFGGDEYNPQGEAYKTMGEKGSDDFKNPNISVINRFHTAMMDENQSLSAENNNNVFKNERGSKGVVLANVANTDQEISTKTSLPDDAKIYSSNDGSSLTVKGGKITGTLKAMSFVAMSTVDLSKTVISDVKVAPTVKVMDGDTELKSSDTDKITFKDNKSLKVSLTDAESASYVLGDNKSKDLKDGDTIDITDTSKLVITAINGTETTTKTYNFVKDENKIEDPVVTASLDGKEIASSETPIIIEKEAKLNLTFKNTQGFTYKIDGKQVDLSTEDMKDAIDNGIDIAVGKGLEAGETQTIEVVPTNEDKLGTPCTYTVKMKANDEEVQAAEITGKYNGSKIDKTIEFTDDAKLDLSFENAENATYTIGNGQAVNLTKDELKDGKSITLGSDAEVGDTITVVVKATNAANKEATETFEFKKISKEVQNEFKLNSAVADKTEVNVGSDVTITCDATGDNVKYALYVKKDDNEEELNNDFSSSKVFTWNAEEAGSYKLRVVAKSGDKEEEKTIDVVVKAIEEKKEFEVSIKADKDTIELGQSIKLTGTVSNQTGTAKYKFKYKHHEDDWDKQYIVSDTKGYLESNTIDWTPKAVGTYDVVVYAQDDKCNGDNYVLSKAITVTVTEKKQEDQKPATTTTKTPGGETQEGDASTALPIVAMMVASAAALVKKFKRQ